MPELRALTIIQPWASAIALGAKRIETRSWPTTHRGLLAIHAGLAASFLPKQRLRGSITRRHDLKSIGRDAMNAAGLPVDRYYYPLGAILAVAELVDCAKLYTGSNYPYWLIDSRELTLGDYRDGRFGWLLANVRALPTPIPCKGALALWRVPEDIAAQVLEALP